MQNLEIGQIVNTFGIKGFLKVKPFTDDITRFEDLKNVYVKTKNETKNLEIEEIKYQKDLVLIKFKGIDRIEDAEKFKNCYLFIDRKDGVELEDNQYYIVDLIGCEVYTDENISLGKVDDIFNTGSNDIYVVKDELGKQVLLPAIADVIKNIDIENKKIIVHLLNGLVD